MLCDKCHKNVATVYMKKSINGNAVEMNLCKFCAEEETPQGIFYNPMPGYFPLNFFNFSNNSILKDLFDVKTSQDKLISKERPSSHICETCKSTLNDIFNIGKFGCSDCYTNFYAEIVPIINKIHANKFHVGKIPEKYKAKLDKTRKIDALKKELQISVEKQEYERAAELRDKINEIINETI